MAANEVRYEKADDGSFISHTHHEDGKDGKYIKPSVNTHSSLQDAAAHLTRAFKRKLSRRSSRRG